MTLDQVAEILYLAYNKDRYAPLWGTAPAKQEWRRAAATLLRELESQMTDFFLTDAAEDRLEMEALVQNARRHLKEASQTVGDYLSGVNDDHARLSILQDLDAADDNLRKALG